MRTCLLLVILVGLLSGCSTIKHWMKTKSYQLSPSHHVVKPKPAYHQPDVIIANLADD